jgi:hypothetical protein
MIANARDVGNPPQASAEPTEIPAFRVMNAMVQTPVLASLTRHRSKAESYRTKRLSPGARLLIMRLVSRFSHYVPDPKAPAYLVGLTEKDRQNRADRWTAWETQRHTANGLGVDERTVRRYLVEAIDSGIVSVESRTTSAGDGTKPRTTNRYRIHLPARWFDEQTQTDGTMKTAIYLTPPAPRRKRPKAAAAAPDYDAEPPVSTPDETHIEPLEAIPDLPVEWRTSYDEADAPERIDMSSSALTDMSANTGSGEQGNISLFSICPTPPRAAASATTMPTQADPEADPDADAAAASWRRPTPDARAGDAGTPVRATAHNGDPDGSPGLAGGREALRAPCDPYVHPRLASIPEHLRSRVSRLQRQQTANVGRGYVRGIAHNIERASTHAAIERGRKYRSANG